MYYIFFMLSNDKAFWWYLIAQNFIGKNWWKYLPRGEKYFVRRRLCPERLFKEIGWKTPPGSYWRHFWTDGNVCSMEFCPIRYCIVNCLFTKYKSSHCNNCIQNVIFPLATHQYFVFYHVHYTSYLYERDTKHW